MTDFSMLPYDVLELVASFLPLQSYYLFGAVCRFWFSVVKERCLSPATRLPWLVLSDNTGTSKRSFFSLPEQKHYFIDIPEISWVRCCGSSHGWVVAVNYKLEHHLLNPLSRARIQLPPLLHFREDVDITKQFDMNNPEHVFYLRYRFMYKAVLSADPSKGSDYAVMAIVGDTKRLALWRPNNLKWTELKNTGGRHEDIIWYNGQFYAITCNYWVIVVDVNKCQVTRRIIPQIHSGTFNTRLRFVGSRYLVDMFGDLVRVARSIVDDPTLDVYDVIKVGDIHTVRDVADGLIKTVEFQVMKFDESNRIWVELAGIGDCALFLGLNASLAVRASEFPGCRQNCIYFTDDYIDGPLVYGDMGIYSLADRKIEPLLPNPRKGLFPAASPPIWLNPSPR